MPVTSGLLATSSPLTVGAGAAGMPSEATIFGKLDEIKGAATCCVNLRSDAWQSISYRTCPAGIVDAVQARIHNPDETTFVCVCIPEVRSAGAHC